MRFTVLSICFALCVVLASPAFGRQIREETLVVRQEKNLMDPSVPSQGDANGNIIPFSRRGLAARQEKNDIDPSIPPKCDADGNIVPFDANAAAQVAKMKRAEQVWAARRK